ncbi:undecaprenyl-diphosphate phosphatase [Leeia aquatica]|uniref:Undecaprenyl-diphosphatase n=1 Tax=Leeia aquatica TaxID=2725557 RepID=A0A847RZV1_9NEIS|nr:undecaprenyl-diphosphate phosphatase [Leeia aquatica]NLR76630.1 undecaprenyl-diphosphate phosphatase [Leeia aquatica]
MDLLLMLKALIMGLVEGITEFLPISSTGHLIITGELLGFLSKEKRDVFEIFIQLGAILAVCWAYRQKITQVVGGLGSQRSAQQFALRLVVAFLPFALMGKLFGEAVKARLFTPVPVALAFIVGGIIILWAERRQHSVRVQEVDDMSLGDAFKLGLIQCFALIPGTSRSGATIVGGLFLGLSRKAAAEFSFFLAIPTLTVASLYSLYKHRAGLTADDMLLFAIGFVVAFISALIAVKALLRFIVRHDFTVFAWYRILFGALVLLTYHFGWVRWAA